MNTGYVKWFNPNKGFGFIVPRAGGKDVFVHITAVQRAGLATLSEGALVEYEVTQARDGRQTADQLKLPGGHISDQRREQRSSLRG